MALLRRGINQKRKLIKTPKGKNKFFLGELTLILQVTFETDAAHNRVFVYTGVPNKNAVNIAEAENVDFSNTITTFEVKISKCDSSGKCTIS